MLWKAPALPAVSWCCAVGRADQFTEFVVEPFGAEIALLLGHPFLQPEMRLDHELGHRRAPSTSIVDTTLAACWHGGHAPRAMSDMTVRNADLSLRDLRVLDVLLRERSLTRAAEQLGTTQPSISKVLARLRTWFGDPLLTRSGQEMHPTPRALEIERPLRGLLLSADVLDRSTPAFAPATSDRTFKLLLSDVAW